ncbi:MAG: glycosyltransferase family 2 protein [Bacteroidaceae bacterium]|nr:glycosyltransferase family 2 protein [Bacteroidaceae bacterium]
MLSILIPTFEYDCSDLLTALHLQCETLAQKEQLDYEIIVADDGSNHPVWQTVQSTALSLSHCTFVRQEHNIGRSRIRNYLAQIAKGERLIFIDSHMSIISPNYIQNYLATDADICQGGYVTEANDKWNGNLRYQYERRARQLNRKHENNAETNRDFHTSNFMVKRQLFLAHPLDESIRRYGYEDVLYGKQLYENGIKVKNIDNPVAFAYFESNSAFVQKTEEGITTLHELRDRIGGFSRLLIHEQRLRKWHLTTPLFGVFSLFRQSMRDNLCGSHPNLHIFDCYKLLFLLSLDRHD